MKKNDIKKYLILNGGGTFTGNFVPLKKDNGYMVSLYGSEQVYSNVDSLLDNIDSIRCKLDVNNYIGIWLDANTDKWYLDMSIYVNNKKDALKIGKENLQIAIFDLKNDSSIYLNYEIPFYTLYEENEKKDLQVYKQFNDRKKLIEFLKIDNIKKLNECISKSIKINNFIIKKDYINIKEL